jgi:all-trans-nonaprenyl-diphosphate synthase
VCLLHQVIADFANGEIAQASSLFDCDVTLETYMDKSFYKTASLIAASCRSAAVFSGMEEEVKQDMFNYGKHLGLAFQVVDDILDFTQTEEQLGKPQGQVTGSPLYPSCIFCVSLLYHSVICKSLRCA